MDLHILLDLVSDFRSAHKNKFKKIIFGIFNHTFCTFGLIGSVKIFQKSWESAWM